MMRRDYTVITLCLLALLCAGQARAEVRAFTDRDGEYTATRVLLDGRSGRIWSPVRSVIAARGAERRGAILNALGDRNGDLFPEIQESTQAPHHPWVVWSRANKDRYDLAWSRWVDDGWQTIDWVDPEGEELGDSLDARLTFDESGRPYVVWWRNQAEGGRIYVSLFLTNYWMRGYAVSELGVDSRNPSIEVPEAGTILVRYDTPNGTVEQEVLFDGTVTITDDINPLDYMHNGQISIITD
jgi:hypothetical protein